MENEKIKTIKNKNISDPKKREVVFSDTSYMQEFLDAGVHFGHLKSYVHPKMFPYIFGARNNVHLIDLEKTNAKLKEALEFLEGAVKENKKILFVGTKFSVRDMTRKLAEDSKMFYVVNYWPGGLLTNWNTIKGRVEKLKELEELRSSDDWGKYTKQERALISRDIEKLQARWDGIRNMEATPDVLFVVDMQTDMIAAKEANKLGIPIVALVDTNIDPSSVDYPIPANDDAVSSVSLILNKTREYIIGRSN